MFAIGFVLACVSFYFGMVFGAPGRQWNKVDYVAAPLFLFGVLLMLGSLVVMLWRLMP
jgi:hypothetical protein